MEACLELMPLILTSQCKSLFSTPAKWCAIWHIFVWGNCLDGLRIFWALHMPSMLPTEQKLLSRILEELYLTSIIFDKYNSPRLDRQIISEKQWFYLIAHSQRKSISEKSQAQYPKWCIPFQIDAHTLSTLPLLHNVCSLHRPVNPLTSLKRCSRQRHSFKWKWTKLCPLVTIDRIKRTGGKIMNAQSIN
jgi:hypothetical protein